MPELETSESSPSTPSSNCDFKRITDQLEFYFGDFNLVKDKFLKDEMEKDEGWIPVETMLNFNRLKSITTNGDDILSALSQNPSELLEVDTEGKRIRRKPHLPVPVDDDDWKNNILERSLYIKGFPQDLTLDDIMKYLKEFGKIDHVFMRYYKDKATKENKFKGSVFVTFSSKQDAHDVLNSATTNYNGAELTKMWRKDYASKKKDERMESKMKIIQQKHELTVQQEAELNKGIQLPSGALIALSEIDENITLLQLKTKLSELQFNVAFVDYTAGAKTAVVRLQTENSAKEALAKLEDNSFELEGNKIKAELIEGEEEQKKLETMKADRLNRIMEYKQNNKSSKFKGRKRGNRNGNESAKRRKTDSEA